MNGSLFKNPLLELHVLSPKLSSILLAGAIFTGGCLLSAQAALASAASTSGASITVNFNSRSGGVSIPANMLGTEYFENLPSNADRSTVAQAGFTNERYHVNVPTLFPTSENAPDWYTLDRDIAKFVAAGVHPFIELEFTPSFLQPKPASCPGDPAASVPTSVGEWGHLAALIAAHLDHNYPGFVRYYEIWNEPNQGGLCSKNELADYIRIYAAAAPQIKAQGVKDGTTLYTGGPAAAGVAFTEILTNAATAPYVDFYSYHIYEGSATNIADGMTWNGAGGTPSLHTMVTNPSSGLQARFLQAYTSVKTAKTPRGAKTPIFLDEYNEDWAFAPDCCRNSPTYSPLFNSMAVAELLNSVYKGASEVPSAITYYAAKQPPFCIVALLDAAMDCATPGTGQTSKPYPQWYTYEMMFSPSFLDLKDGGHMATSLALSSGASSAGIIATAFYTSTMDSILIINPTESSFSGVSLQINSSGRSGLPKTYILNSTNQHISTWQASTTSSSSGVHVTFNLPRYSVIGISLK